MKIRFKDGVEFYGSLDEWNAVKGLDCFPQEKYLDAEVEINPEVIKKIKSSEDKKIEQIEPITEESRIEKTEPILTKKRIKNLNPRDYIQPKYRAMIELIKNRQENNFVTEWSLIKQKFKIGTDGYVKNNLKRLGVLIEGRSDTAILTIDKTWCDYIDSSAFPDLFKIDESMKEIVRQVIHHMVTHNSVMTYVIEGQYIGLESIDDWNEFCRSVIQKSKAIEDYFAVGKGLKIKLNQSGFVLCYH